MKRRIKDYHPHPDQRAFHEASKAGGNIIVTSSIRSGKTFGLIHDAIRYAWNQPDEYAQTMIAAPTYRQLSTVVVKPMISKLKYYGLLQSYNGEDYEAVLKNGKHVVFRSLTDPDSAVRGLTAARIYVDEAAYTSKEAIDVLRGRLITTGGDMILITTPNGIGSWFYTDLIETPLPNTTYLKFKLENNPAINEEKIRELRQIYDPLLAKQELEGEWVNLYGDQVYYQFSDENIKSHYQTTEQIYVGLDFNLDKNAWVALQQTSTRTLKILGEGYGARTTADAAQQIIQRYGNKVVIIPDPTGKNRIQGTATTHIQMLKQAGLPRVLDRESNIPRTERYALVNSLFLNALGERRILIDPSCTRLIKELRELAFKPGTDVPNNKGDRVGHITDALGYCCFYVTGGTIGKLKTQKDI